VNVDYRSVSTFSLFLPPSLVSSSRPSNIPRQQPKENKNSNGVPKSRFEKHCPPHRAIASPCRSDYIDVNLLAQTADKVYGVTVRQENHFVQECSVAEHRNY
jgi:hypothetical protein